MKRLIALCAGGVILAASLPAAADEEVSLAGFGTVAYAQSNRSYRYQRFIDSGGTFQRDSRLGMQLDVRLTPAWSATVQAALAPAADSDRQWDLTLPWAFLSWRPDNDWLLRAGKLRLPLLRYSETMDVGTTFNFARLPIEVYSLAPTAEVTGVAVARSWLDERRELSLEGYLGSADSYWRFFRRDAAPRSRPRGAWFEHIEMWLTGALLTVREGDHRLRLSVHRGDVKRVDAPIPVTYPFVPVAGGGGYYQVTDALPGPGVPTVDRVLNYTFTASAEFVLPHEFTVTGEAVRRRVTRATLGTDSWAAYVALQKRIGAWTPYVYAARILSSSSARRLYADVNGNLLPASTPGADIINPSQRVGVDSLDVFDQRSIAVGSAYLLTPQQKLKVEWLHSHTGSTSGFLDAPSGENSGHRAVDVLSLSYDFTF
ncbi:MAG: hypothetical protein JSR69_03015 [Proteobacteria bacterium]|nr:hypothetical protein [Pseudomonadota bacterium]